MIGFIGLGTMGGPIATHLLKATGGLMVYDVSLDALGPWEAAGALIPAGIPELGGECEFVFLSLPTPVIVESVVSDLVAGVNRPRVIVDLSTNSLSMVRHLGSVCSASGVVYVDAPVSGGRPRAESGSLSVMVGAEAQVFGEIEPLLGTFAAEVFRLGDLGSGTVAKLVNNQLFLAGCELVQECYTLGVAAGLDVTVLHRVIRASSAAPFGKMAPFVLSREFEEKELFFRLALARKDLELAVDMATEVGAAVPATAAALGVYRGAEASGLGEKTFHSTLVELERSSQLDAGTVHLRRRGS